MIVSGYSLGVGFVHLATESIDKTAAQVRSETNRITAEILEKVGELKQLGQDKLVEQMDHISSALDTGKTAVEAA